VGVKVIAIPQLAPTATVPHWLLAAKSPLAETESTDRAAVPELVTVTDWVGLVVPTWRPAKVSDAGLTVRAGDAPVPASGTVSVPRGLISIVSVPVRGPPDDGS